MQWADANRDTAEKMTTGGPYTVRADDIGAVSGDTGYVASAELRPALGQFASGSLRATAFIDTARVTGAGVGLVWGGPDAWRVSLSVGTPIGAGPAIVARQSPVRARVAPGKPSDGATACRQSSYPG